MRRILSVLVACFFLQSSLSASAEESSKMGDESSEKEEFKSDRLWHLAELPAWWFAWLAAHEGSHALMGKYWDWDVKEFQPYPHYTTFREGHPSVFVWGSVTLECSQKHGVYWDGNRYVEGDYWPACKFGGGLAAIRIAPYALNATTFLVSDLILSYHVDPDSVGGTLLYMGGMVGPWVNTAFGTNFFTGGPDMMKFSEVTGIPSWATILTVDAIAALGAWRLYVHGKDILYDKKHSSKEKGGIILTPMMQKDAFGLSLGARW